MNQEEVVDVRVERVGGVHRATGVAADRKGANLAVLQSQPNAWCALIHCTVHSVIGA